MEEIEKQGDSKMESLMKVEFLFDYFISKLKRNSFMEMFMCQSDNEEVESEREDSMILHQSVTGEGEEQRRGAEERRRKGVAGEIVGKQKRIKKMRSKS